LKASPNAENIAAGFSDSVVKLWTVTSTKPDVPATPPKTLVGHSSAVFGLDFSRDNNYLLTGSEDKTSIKFLT
jgi:transcription initiation factor TFIID subunit 5